MTDAAAQYMAIILHVGPLPGHPSTIDGPPSDGDCRVSDSEQTRVAMNSPGVAVQQTVAGNGGLLSLIQKFPTVAFIAASIVIVNLFIPATKFADFPVYLWITDALYYYNPGGWFGFEAGSNLLFIGLRALTGNTVMAISVAHYLLGAFFVFAMLRFAQRDEVGWRGMLMAFGLYGALLSFVTIRATPAYMLVTFGALEIARGRARGVLFALLGTMFHVSAILAVPPMIVGLAQNRLRVLSWMTDSTKALVAVVGLGMLLFGLLQGLFNSALLAVVNAIPFLNKYIVYTAGLDPINANQSGGRSINHLIYAVVVSAFVFAFVIVRNETCRRLRGYVLTSYILFLILEIAPVTAYRQSQFWMLPALFVFPWQLLAPTGLRAWLFGGLFILSFFFAVPGVIWW